jgi:predicted nucleic acid-binding protein
VGLLILDELAATHGLSVYDAAYLELAVRRALPLATRDAALLKALPGAGLQAALPSP